MNKTTKIGIVLLLMLVLMITMACIGPCVLGDACSGAVWSVVTQTAKAVQQTATYGADQFNQQLTAIATSIPK